MTTFRDRWREYRTFHGDMNRYARLYFAEHVQPENDAVDPIGRVSSWSVDEDEICFLWEARWNYGGYDSGYAYAPLEDFLRFAKQQWELDQFERKLDDVGEQHESVQS